MASIHRGITEVNLEFVNSLASSVTSQEKVYSRQFSTDPSDYCQCYHLYHAHYDQIDEEYLFICSECSKIVDMGHSVDLNQLADDDMELPKGIQAASMYSSNPDLCSTQRESEAGGGGCSKCGNSDPSSFTDIVDNDNITIVCTKCNNIINLLNDLSLEDSFTSFDVFDTKYSEAKHMMFYPDAGIVTCSICDKTWKLKEDGSMQLDAELHSHGDTFPSRNNKSNLVNCTEGDICNEAPSWKKIENVEELIRGDHICYWNLYWKHAIVLDINLTLGKLWITRYKLTPTCKIIETCINIRDYTFQKAIYPGRTYDPDVVVGRARSRFQEERYNILTNYARAFPRWCKTGYGGIFAATPSDLQTYHLSQSEAISQEEVLDIDSLFIGDHIKWWRKGFHSHHAIITDFVQRKNQKFVDVIHYALMDIPNSLAGKLVKIIEKWYWVEVTVERLKWCSDDQKLVSYTSTVGTQYTQKGLNPDCLHGNKDISDIVVTEDGRSIAIQVNQEADIEDTMFDGTMQNEMSPSEDGVGNKAISKITQYVLKGDEENDMSLPDNGILYKVIYSGIRHPIDIIIEKAKSKIGEANYLLLKNNCEHFATWCTTGKLESKQVEKLIEKGMSLSSEVIVELLASLDACLCDIPEIFPRLLKSVKMTLSKVVKIIPAEVVGILVFVVIEIIIKSLAIFRCCKSCRNGYIDSDTRNIHISKEISELIGTITGGTIGMLLGSLVPIPVIGNIVGLVAGVILGQIAGRKVAYEMALRQKQKAIEAKKQKME